MFYSDKFMSSKAVSPLKDAEPCFHGGGPSYLEWSTTLTSLLSQDFISDVLSSPKD